MVICLTLIMEFISAAIGCSVYLNQRNTSYLTISRNYNESQTSKWVYQHLVILLRYENRNAVIVIFKQIDSLNYFDKTRFILNHNYNFKIGHLKQ
jgi:hypothetical protein